MLKVFIILVYSFIFIPKSLALKQIHGIVGDEVRIECSIKGEACLFTSARGQRVCTDDEDRNCERHQGIEIKQIGDVCHLIFSPLEDRHYGQWLCQDETWYGDIEILNTFQISPPMDIFVELTYYFGDVYFQQGDGLNVSCLVSVDSEKEYKEYPGNPLQWRVGNEVVPNDNPYVQTDVNSWVQILNYNPEMDDNHKRLSCYINEDIEDQTDGINLHMVSFEFHSQTIHVTLQENMDEEIILESTFESYPEPRKENVVWKVGGIELHPGETKENGFSSTKIISTGDSEYDVKLHIPPNSIDINKLIQEENYLSVDLVNIREPFKVPIVFEMANKNEETILPVPPPPPPIVPSESEPTVSKDSTQSTVTKLANSSILGYILGGIIAFIVLTCCIVYYIYKCCCEKGTDDHSNNYYPKESETKILQPLNLEDTSILKDNVLKYDNSVSILDGSSKVQKREMSPVHFSTFTSSPDNEKESRKLTWSQINEESYTTEEYNPAYQPANDKGGTPDVSSTEKKEPVRKGQISLPVKDTSVFYTESNQKSKSEDLHYSQRDLILGAKETSLVGQNIDGNANHSERHAINQTNDTAIETTMRSNTSMQLSSLRNQEVVQRQTEIKSFSNDSERLPNITDSRESYESGYRPIRDHISSNHVYTPLSRRSQGLGSPQSGSSNNDEYKDQTNRSYTETNTLPKKSELFRQSSDNTEYNGLNRVTRDTAEYFTFPSQTTSPDEVDFNEANRILNESAISLSTETSSRYLLYNQSQGGLSKGSSTPYRSKYQAQSLTNSDNFVHSPTFSTFKETLGLPSNSIRKSSESVHSDRSFYENVNNNSSRTNN